MEKIEYKPRKNGFPYKILMYLLENSRSFGVDIQEEIGLNKWCDDKGRIYYGRASAYFDNYIRQLEKLELIVRFEDDQYQLTKQGRQFTETLKKSR